MKSLTWGQGTSAQGCASSGGSNSCAHLHALAWESQGLPKNPQAHIGMHTSMLQAHSELCLQICPQRPSPARDGDMDNLLGHRTQGIYMCQGASGMCTINNQDTQTPKRDTADRL